MSRSTIRPSRPTRERTHQSLLVTALAAFVFAGTLGAQARSTPPVKRPSKPTPAPSAASTRKPADSAATKAGSPPPLTAQPAPTPPAAPPAAPPTILASISGTIYDSVHAAPLRQAAVMLEGANRMSITNADGRYSIDSVPPGKHQIRVEHALLDSIGFEFVTNEFELADNQARIIDLAIPSSQTLVAVACPPARRALGPSAIVGRLLDADSDAPVKGVRVSFAWSEISLTAGLRKVPRLRDAVTDSSGVFRVCGLPNQVEGTLQAENKGITTSEVRVVFEGQPLVIQGLRIGNAQTVTRAQPDSGAKPAPNAASGPRFSAPTLQSGQAVLTGRVVTASGAPVAGARVSVEGTRGAALTKENGEFTLTNLPSGTQTAVAHQIGFAPVDKAVELSTRAPASVTIVMSKPAQVLAPIVVTAERDEGLDKIGFSQRKKVGFGTFITGEEVMKRAPNVLTDVFRTVPGIRVSPGGQFGTDYVVEDARGTGIGSACVKYMLDGSPYEAIYPGDIDRLIPPWDIGAIEVYHGTDTPAQFATAGSSGCMVIVIWSKNHVENAGRKRR